MKACLVCLLLGGTVLLSCRPEAEGRSGEQPAAAVEKAETPEPRMQPSAAEGAARIGSGEYTYKIRRKADGTLPRVELEDGTLYEDNTIELQVFRPDGSQLYARTFRKTDFSSVVDEPFLSHAILEGLVFDRVDGGRLLFAASICYPQTDLYMAARVYISPSGQLSIEKEDAMDDTLADDPAETEQ